VKISKNNPCKLSSTCYNSSVEEIVLVRVPESTRDMAKVASAKLKIPLIEFLRRAVQRELAYNDRRVKK
jgi:hypothetical protein